MRNLEKLARALAETPHAEHIQPENTDNCFCAIRISRNAFQKANDACRAIAETLGQHFEFYSYLCVKRGQQDDVIRDVYLAHDQQVAPYYCMVDAPAISRTAQAIHERGYSAVGWCHAHPGFSTNPSGTDRQNNETILAQLLAENQYAGPAEAFGFPGLLTARVEKVPRQKPRLVVSRNRRDLEGLSLEFDRPRGIKGAVLRRWMYTTMLRAVEAGELKIAVPERYAYAYSVVVNGNPAEAHGEVFYRRICSFCPGDSRVERKKIPIRIVDVQDDVQYTMAELCDEASGRLSVLGQPPEIGEGEEDGQV